MPGWWLALWFRVMQIFIYTRALAKTICPEPKHIWQKSPHAHILPSGSHVIIILYTKTSPHRETLCPLTSALQVDIITLILLYEETGSERFKGTSERGKLAGSEPLSTPVQQEKLCFMSFTYLVLYWTVSVCLFKSILCPSPSCFSLQEADGHELLHLVFLAL